MAFPSILCGWSNTIVAATQTSASILPEIWSVVDGDFLTLENVPAGSKNNFIPTLKRYKVEPCVFSSITRVIGISCYVGCPTTVEKAPQELHSPAILLIGGRVWYELPEELTHNIIGFVSPSLWFAVNDFGCGVILIWICNRSQSLAFRSIIYYLWLYPFDYFVHTAAALPSTVALWLVWWNE